MTDPTRLRELLKRSVLPEDLRDIDYCATAELIEALPALIEAVEERDALRAEREADKARIAELTKVLSATAEAAATHLNTASDRARKISTLLDRVEELERGDWLLARLCDAYELLCNDTGKNYHESAGSYYAEARRHLARATLKNRNAE